MAFLLGDRVITRIWAKHDIDPDRYPGVLASMRVLGAPTIKCVEFRGEVYALEGSHRLKAAHELGLRPVIKLLDPELGWGALDQFWETLHLVLPPYSWEEYQ